MATNNVDPEAALETLIDEDIVNESPDGALTTTESFERTQAVYHDTYVALGDDEYTKTVADVFGIDEETAASRIEQEGVTRDELVSYLSLKSELETVSDEETLAVMTEIVTQLTPESPVPDGLTELDDDSYDPFLRSNPDAVLMVWKRFCDPCDAMKAELDAVLAEIPGHIAVAGLEGEECDGFVNRFDSAAAPGLVIFSDGKHEATVTGRQSPEDVEGLVDEHF